MKNLVMGASTGYLYANNILSIPEHEKILKEAKAECFEINLGPHPAERIKLLLGPEEFENFGYRALHLGYDKTLTLEEQLSLVKKIIDKHKITTAVIHPDVVIDDYYQKAIQQKIPLAIEKMDKDKVSGFLLGELEKIISTYGFTFVLDVQHAYEHDHNMGYAKDLFDAFCNKLVHLHVSGETEDNIHSLIYKARNTSKIVDFTNTILSKNNAPIILEGEYKTAEELRNEIEFLTKELTLI